jgi:hypothetical protein
MLLKNIILGIKKSNNIQILPNKILLIINNPISRILRVMGGISFILTISKNIILLTTNKIIIIIIQILGIIFISYCLMLNIYRVIRIIKIIRNKEYEVRNSPLNKIASLSSQVIMCFKGVCYIGGTTGTVLGVGLGLDKILNESGRSAIFKPATSIIVDKILNNIGIPNTNIPKSNDIKLDTNDKLLDFIKENEKNKIKAEDMINNLNKIKWDENKPKLIIFENEEQLLDLAKKLDKNNK